MRRLIRAFWLIALIGGGGDATAAGFDAAKIADIKTAGAAFLALGKDAYKTGQPPRQSDPAVAKLLDTLFGTDACLNGPPAVTFAQFLAVNDWLSQVVNVGLVYVTAGTGIADLAGLGAVTAKQQEQMNVNVVDLRARDGPLLRRPARRDQGRDRSGDRRAGGASRQLQIGHQGAGRSTRCAPGSPRPWRGWSKPSSSPASIRPGCARVCRRYGAGADRGQIPRIRPEAGGLTISR